MPHKGEPPDSARPKHEPDQGAHSPVEQLIKEVAGRAVKQEAERGKIGRSGQRVLPAARYCLSAAGALHASKVHNAYAESAAPLFLQCLR